MCLPHLTQKVLAGMSAGKQTIVFIMKKYFENLSHIIINIHHSHIGYVLSTVQAYQKS